MEELSLQPLLVMAIVTLFVMYAIYVSIAIAGENERFAVFVLGRFAGFKGPGLIMKSAGTRLVRLSVGSVGTITSAEFVNFTGVEIPIEAASDFRVGESVQIDGFNDAIPRIMRTSIRPKTHCPNCGHEF